MSSKPKQHKPKKPPFGVFLSAVIVMFFLTLSSADSVGFVPYYIDGSLSPQDQKLALSDLPLLGEAQKEVSKVTEKQHTALPERIVIPSISMDLAIQNPSTRDVNILDALLQQGPARYVDSAKLGESGNMIIFAHSSHLPIVHNQMFRAFNRVPELKAGDSINLLAEGKTYIYTVVSVEKADATDTSIDLSKTLGTRLTLVTCDTLTGKSARFILTADFVGIE
jgi:LPXTG-site transpeptidase (sortase) family protein